MSSYLRRIERRIIAKKRGDKPFRICQRVKRLSHRQAQRGVRKID